MDRPSNRARSIRRSAETHFATETRLDPRGRQSGGPSQAAARSRGLPLHRLQLRRRQEGANRPRPISARRVSSQQRPGQRARTENVGPPAPILVKSPPSIAEFFSTPNALDMGFLFRPFVSMFRTQASSIAEPLADVGRQMRAANPDAFAFAHVNSLSSGYGVRPYDGMLDVGDVLDQISQFAWSEPGLGRRRLFRRRSCLQPPVRVSRGASPMLVRAVICCVPISRVMIPAICGAFICN
jgi:hypothetical protein